MSSFYKTFEDNHRGSRELIASRLRQYLPFLEPMKAEGSLGNAIDLGCGRGEWLELLDSLGIKSEGVDLDQDMLEVCRAIGLNVRQDGALPYLRRQQDESIDLVTAFHVVEHLSFDHMNDLIADAYRVLRPGGLLILETPNPENLVVATSSFYLDPTHLRPVPPALLQYCVTSAGFRKVIVVRLQENPALRCAETVTLMDALAGVSPDYSVVALKPGDAERSAALGSAFSKEFGLQLSDLSGRFERRLRQMESQAVDSAQRLNEISRWTLDVRMKYLESQAVETTAQIDQLRQDVCKLCAQLREAESSIDYASRRKILERIFFRPDGRPIGPLRRLLFHTSGKPRGVFRRFVLHKEGNPRSAFSRWMISKDYLRLRG